MSGAPTGIYRGVPAATRRAERRERLLDAGLDLLGTEGWQATTVRGVCRRARLTPRYFYESFDDLDALVVAVFDRVADELTAAAVAAYAAAPDDLEAKSEATVGAFVDVLTEDPRRGRVAFVEALGNEALGRRRLDRMHDIAQLVVTTARGFAGVPGDRDPIARIAAAMLVGGLAEIVIARIDGRFEDVSRDDLVADVAHLWVVTGAAAMARGRARAVGPG